MAIPAMRIITTPKLEIDEFQRCSVSLVNISRDFKDMNEASGAFNQISDCSDPLGFAVQLEAYATFWPKDPPARVAVQVAALAGNASAAWPWRERRHTRQKQNRKKKMLEF